MPARAARSRGLMLGLSVLRVVGLGVGVAVLLVATVRLRHSAAQRVDVALLAVFGLALCAVSVAPDLVNLPAEIFALGDVPGGRIITLLIFSTLLLWLLLFWERSKLNALGQAFEASVRRSAVEQFAAAPRAPLPAAAVWVLVPVLNEAENLERLLPRMPRTVLDRPVTVLVIDDGSSDTSADVARAQGAQAVSLLINRGGGSALKTGFELARRYDAAAVVTMDGDGQHDPDEIAALVEPILADEADVVIGSRLLGAAEHATPLRAAGLHVFNAVINMLMSTHVTDCSSGFRAIRMASLAELQLTQEQYHTAELIIEATKHGCRIAERPITISARMTGRSKKGTDVRYGFFFLRTILKAWLR